MFTYKSERKRLKQQTKNNKKRTCATSASTGAAVDTGDTVRRAPGREARSHGSGAAHETCQKSKKS